MPKPLFTRDTFPTAPGGQIYEWGETETKFEIPADGIFVIAIAASAKNAEQNNSTDDDDLRVNLDGFDFGKYEIHDEKVSWKGFGTAASFDGASLKGGTKTVYIFVELKKGEHILKFFADEKPVLKKIEISQLADKKFELDKLSPPENISSNRKGIPWVSFVFLGLPTKILTLGVKTKSAKVKGGTDGDNLKVVVNGKILANKKTPTSDKYKNFYFSGDLNEFDVLSLGEQELNSSLAFENSVEFWYDESPEITGLKVEFMELKDFLDSLDVIEIKTYYLSFAYLIILSFKTVGWKYSADFLFNSLKDKPKNLTFQFDDPIVKKIKSDPTYKKITKKLKEKISARTLNGELWPNEFKDGINFESKDLATALHGIKKIEFEASEKSAGKFEVEFVIFDVYDFEKIKYEIEKISEWHKIFANNQMDAGELVDVIKNFEIKINISDIVKIEDE